MSELDDGLLGDFLAECREHLASIETDLLAVERGGADIDEVLVNKVFRAAHSIKGGAGFFNLSRIQELSHQAENVLNMVRSRDMVPTPEVVNILLMSFDKLREMVNAPQESRDADIADFVVALAGLTSAHLPASQKGAVSRNVSIPMPEKRPPIVVSEFDLDRARKGGNYIYLLEYDLIHDVERHGKTPLTLLRSLVEVGTILESAFDLESVGTLDDEPDSRLLLQVLYASVLDPSIIHTAVELPERSVRVIEPSRPKAAVVVHEPVEEPEAAGIQPPSHLRLAPPPRPEPAAAAAPAPGEAGKGGAASTGEATLRVNVALLERLMNLAGELVLARNQLGDAIARTDLPDIRSGGQRISAVTSELQEAAMLARMQPIANVFNKFPRLVRDLSRELGKEVRLTVIGRDVEMDKTLVEGLSDPLTHMVRNAVDHGVESAEARVAAGKDPIAHVILKASHQAGQVVIEVIDDGKGIDPDKVAGAAESKGLLTREQVQTMTEQEKVALVFLPGLSTAKAVTDVSGRGVGMDVVKTNLDKLGGKVDIETAIGRGTTFRIKLPLTLAIIPSLLVSVGDEPFAIPELDVSELIRVPKADVATRIQQVGDAEVLILRDMLVPLVDLAAVMGVDDQPGGRPVTKRRLSRETRDLHVVVVTAGALVYGLVVDRLHDTVEIVVKPLGRHLKGLTEYAGATILGDGRVAVILDPAGLAASLGLSALAGGNGRTGDEDAQTVADVDVQTLLFFRNAPGESCAVPLQRVSRVEQIRGEQIEMLGGRRTMQYRGASLPLIALKDTASVGEFEPGQSLVVVIFEAGDREFGLLGATPVDVVETALAVDPRTLRQTGVLGSAIVRGQTTLIIDVDELVEATHPDALPARISLTPQASEEAGGPASGPLLLLAEDSDFFRSQLIACIEGAGFRVVAGRDGREAWELLQQHGDAVRLLVTDIEMPRMTGLELAEAVRGDSRFRALPIIAVTSLAADEDMARGHAAGVSEYQVKLDKIHLLESIQRHLEPIAAAV